MSGTVTSVFSAGISGRDHDAGVILLVFCHDPLAFSVILVVVVIVIDRIEPYGAAGHFSVSGADHAPEHLAVPAVFNGDGKRGRVVSGDRGILPGGSSVIAGLPLVGYLSGAALRCGGKFAGCNFWGWGGLAQPKHVEQWKVGDDYTGDPAQEAQGLNSVFVGDTSTLQIIKSQVERMNRLR